MKAVIALLALTMVGCGGRASDDWGTRGNGGCIIGGPPLLLQTINQSPNESLNSIQTAEPNTDAPDEDEQ